MALNFPDSPVAGTVFGAWRYDGVKWGAVSGVSGGGSAGDITAVLAGAGLSGGGTEGDVSIALAVPVTVARGGTGATDAATALANLGGAPLGSPTFTGDPKAPTPATADNDTSIATTAYVKAQGYQTGNQTITLSGDASGSGATAITTTLATVNANVGTFQGLTINAKGLVTAAASQSYLTAPVNLASQVTGTLPIANGGTGATTGAVGPYLPLVAGSGNALTGDLYIAVAGANPSRLILNKSASGQMNSISGQTAGNWRWVMQLGDTTAESAGAGSNFSLSRHNDAGTVIDTPLTIRRDTGDITLTHSPTVNSVWPNYALNKPASGTGCMLTGLTNGLNRWVVYVGDSFAESGGNAGSNFSINRFNDAGALIDTPLTISRSSGIVTMPNPLVLNNDLRMAGTREWRFFVGGSSEFHLWDAVAGASRIQVKTDGACWNQTGTWNALSDISTKRDIQPYTRGLADLVQLEPVTFKYNGRGGTVDDDQQMYGLVAQQVQPIVPEIVNTTQAGDEELLGVDSGRLTFAMLNALREIEARLRALEE